MQLEIKPTNKFGLEYYQVVSVSDPHPIVIAEFMSLQGRKPTSAVSPTKPRFCEPSAAMDGRPF